MNRNFFWFWSRDLGASLIDQIEQHTPGCAHSSSCCWHVRQQRLPVRSLPCVALADLWTRCCAAAAIIMAVNSHNLQRPSQPPPTLQGALTGITSAVADRSYALTRSSTPRRREEARRGTSLCSSHASRPLERTRSSVRTLSHVDRSRLLASLGASLSGASKRGYPCRSPEMLGQDEMLVKLSCKGNTQAVIQHQHCTVRNQVVCVYAN
jgi:hypothetical protein